MVEQKENQLNICTDFLQHAEADDNVMKLIFVGDETWVYVFYVRIKWHFYSGGQYHLQDRKNVTERVVCVLQELVASIYSLFISVAESHSRLLLDSLLNDEDKNNVLQLIQLILQCSNSPGVYPINENTSQLALGFWYILQVWFLFYKSDYTLPLLLF
jgi:hypothetical protein